MLKRIGCNPFPNSPNRVNLPRALSRRGVKKLNMAQQLKLRATRGEVGLRRLLVQPPKGGFALCCPQFQLLGRRRIGKPLSKRNTNYV